MEYLSFFGFKDAPFKTKPDPVYFFPSDTHREAVQTVLHGVQAGDSHIVITGEPGTGKTLLLLSLLGQLGEHHALAVIPRPRLSALELIRAMLEDLGYDPEDLVNLEKPELVETLYDFSLEMSEQGKAIILMIDAAHHLPDDTLQELIRIPDYVVNGSIRIILFGRPRLNERLKTPDLEKLNRLISLRHQLLPLSREDTAGYIQHRLQAAGGEPSRFMPKVMKEINKISQGIPRHINIICERSLMAAYVEGSHRVDPNHLEKAISSIVGNGTPRKSTALKKYWPPKPVLIAVVAVTLIISFLGGLYLQHRRSSTAGSAENGETTAQSGLRSGLAVHQPQDPQLTYTQRQPKPGPPSTDLTPTLPSPPLEALNLPINGHLISVDRTRKRAYLWRGNNKGPQLQAELPLEAPPEDGIYIMGQKRDRTYFMFQYPRFIEDNLPMPEETWRNIADVISDQVLLVLSKTNSNRVNQQAVQRAAIVRDTILTWAEAWRNKDLDRLMDFYGDRFMNYSIKRKDPKVYTRESFRTIKQRVFERSGDISVYISDPVCVLDPMNPDRVVVAFQQKYQSSVYSDEGTQIVYLQWSGSQGNAPGWLMKAKLFVEHPISN